MSETDRGGYMDGHRYLTAAAKSGLNPACWPLDAVTGDPETSPEHVAAAQAELAETQALFTGACAEAGAARQADREAAGPEPASEADAAVRAHRDGVHASIQRSETGRGQQWQPGASHDVPEAGA
jgi:hypothetical protein